MSSWIITNAIAAWLIPPGCLLLLAGIGGLSLRQRPRLGKTLIVLSLACLWLLSTPWTGRALIGLLEPPALDPRQIPPAQAIVVLSGGKYHSAPEYGADTTGGATLVRLRYAAHLYQLTGKPILVSGGSPEGGALPEAQTMKAVLESAFRTPVAWTEDASNTTLENARGSRAILNTHNIHRIYLVTHAWHMPRAQRVFAAAGFDVVPAPTAFASRHGFTLLDCLPNADALHQSNRFFHEVIGLLWYRLKSALD